MKQENFEALFIIIVAFVTFFFTTIITKNLEIALVVMMIAICIASVVLDKYGVKDGNVKSTGKIVLAENPLNL